MVSEVLLRSRLKAGGSHALLAASFGSWAQRLALRLPGTSYSNASALHSFVHCTFHHLCSCSYSTPFAAS